MATATQQFVIDSANFIALWFTFALIIGAVLDVISARQEKRFRNDNFEKEEEK